MRGQNEAKMHKRTRFDALFLPSPRKSAVKKKRNQEYLVGASPEMFVRCERTRDGIRVETCPISGTIERGANPLEDAQKIRTLLSNKKEESELTMCTDVDRCRMRD